MRDFSEWNSITTPATLDHLLGHGPGAAAGRPALDGLHAVAPAVQRPHRRADPVPFLVVGAWRLRRERQFATAFGYAGAAARVLHDPRPDPRARAASSSTRPWGSRRTRTCSRSRARSVVAVWLAARRRGLRTRTALARALVGGLVDVRGGRGRLVRARRPCELDRAERTAREPLPRPSTTPGPAPTDRVMSVDAAGVEVLERPRRRRARRRPGRDGRGGRPCLRHPLARAPRRRRGAAVRAGPGRRHATRLGRRAGVPPRATWPSTRSASRPATSGAATTASPADGPDGRR